MALSLKMADNKESHVLRDEVRSNSLLNAILPIDVILETQNTMMATHFSKSPYWQSLLIIGQSQVQRNGLLFQAALTHASSDKQIMYVMTKEFTRIPPTTHSLPNVETGNMANITFKYCQEMKSLEELLIGFCTIPNELLPDVLVVNGLNEYKRGKGPLSQFHYSSILSLLSETAEYIGRRKKTTIMLYVSLSLLLALTVEEQKPWIELFKQWTHEVWILEGNSNRLVSGNIHIQFTVLGSNIFLRTVSKID
ncbi:hypothetical protein DAPPUDRAFT_304438 [Daphnia pulex]|uniref:Uncharacterized protein n=1 Tax=Daphnia pulex TaxID=6669 RepID=E9GLR5_DAPPU|nr:hypothetical protein DAPPUDRAFT_304438 [Daphnia pulex]|eukprot:EFX79553.1 hypothetical protein DAPPUDRAFT_304438 [Daphnia pulex]